MLEIIELVVLQSDWVVSIKPQNIDALWATYVLTPNFTSDQTLFLNFINKKRFKASNLEYNGKHSYKDVSLFTHDEQKHLFTQILCNPTHVDYSKITYNLAKCFYTYFKLINKEEGFIDTSSKRVDVLNY